MPLFQTTGFCGLSYFSTLLIVAVTDNSPTEAFQYVIQCVVSKQTFQWDTKLRTRLLSTNRGSNGSAGGGANRSGIVRKTSISMPNAPSTNPEIHRSLAYLTVLHGIVWSYPREMIPLLQDPDTNALLLKFITSTFIPITVRETLLCMVSNWCILFKEDTASRLNLESVVDNVKEKTNLRPVWQLLPIPPLTHDQPGWTYPPPTTSPPKTAATTTAADSTSPRNTNEHISAQNRSLDTLGGGAQGSIPVVTLPQASSDIHLHHHQQQSYDPNSGTIDPIFLSQQRALIESVQMSRNVSEDNTEVSPEFIKHMDASSEEVISMCDILTETLISLDVQEDPTENAIVTDMVDDVKKRKTPLINFIEMLGPENVDVLSKLTAATDRIDRCLWLFDKTQNSHNEWKAIQESLRTSVTEGMRGVYLDEGDNGAGGSSTSAVAAIAAALSSISQPYASESQGESSRAMASMLAATTSATSLSTSSVATGFESHGISPVRFPEDMPMSIPMPMPDDSLYHRQQQQQQQQLAPLIDFRDASASAVNTSTHRMSSKAKGKMVDLMDGGDADGWDGYYNNNSNVNTAANASNLHPRPSGEGNSNYDANSSSGAVGNHRI
ncbi:hypothetical protein H4217_000846 [Coemansia sp. RSA 1939]|nr:hypothetical protein H4217_000846 [Coemansia sp. RSA 1939]